MADAGGVIRAIQAARERRGSDSGSSVDTDPEVRDSVYVKARTAPSPPDTVSRSVR